MIFLFLSLYTFNFNFCIECSIIDFNISLLAITERLIIQI